MFSVEVTRPDNGAIGPRCVAANSHVATTVLGLVGVLALSTYCLGQSLNDARLARKSGSLSISLIDETERQGERSFRFKVVDARDGSKHAFELVGPYLRRVEDVFSHRDRRLIVIGATGVGGHVSIVDIAKGQVLDSFLCFGPRVSSDGRFVAFSRFVPRGAPAHSNVYLVYDVSKSAAENRPAAVDARDAENVGWPVYPKANVARHAYAAPDGYSPLDGITHSAGSELLWAGDTLLAFVDLSQQQTRLVAVDVTAGLSSPLVAETVLDKANLVNMDLVEEPDRANVYLIPEVLKHVPGDELRLRLGFRADPALRVRWLDVVVGREKFGSVRPEGR